MLTNILNSNFELFSFNVPINLPQSIKRSNFSHDFFKQIYRQIGNEVKLHIKRRSFVEKSPIINITGRDLNIDGT